jgi:hypothetical protein
VATSPPIDSSYCTNSGNDTATTSWAISRPAQAAGDLIICLLASDAYVEHQTLPGGPNGETAITITNTFGGSAQRMSIWYWVASAAATAGTVTVTPSATEQWTATVVRVPAGEFDATTPIHDFGTAGRVNRSTNTLIVSSAAVTVPTGAGDEDARLCFWAAIDREATDSTPTGWTNHANIDRGQVGGVFATRDAAVYEGEEVPSYEWTIPLVDTSSSVVWLVRAPVGGGAAQDIPPTGIATTEAHGTPTITVAAAGLDIPAVGIATGEAFGTPTAALTSGGDTASVTLTASADDGEEFVGASASNPTKYPSGYNFLTSSDIDLNYDPSHNVIIGGLRFRGLAVPQGATVTSATLEVISNGTGTTGSTSVTVRGNAADNAAALTQDADYSSSSDLSTRSRTTASVTWSISGTWTNNTTYSAPDLSTVVQEIINRSGWASGNALLLILDPSSGTDYRGFYSVDGSASKGATLTVGYTISDGANIPASGILTGEAHGTITITRGSVTRTVVAIGTGEAWGTPTTTRGAVTRSVTGIATAEAHGTVTTTLGPASLRPVGLLSQEAWGTPSTAVGPVTRSLVGIVTAEGFGTPSRTVGAVTRAVLGIASLESHGTATISRGAVSRTLVGIPTAEGWGSPTIAIGVTFLTPVSIPTGEAIGTPLLELGAAIIRPTPIGSGEVWGTPQIYYQQFLYPLPIATGEALGAPSIALGLTWISPVSVSSAESWGSPTFSVGGVARTLVAIPSGESWGHPSWAFGSVSRTVLPIPSLESFGLLEFTMHSFPPQFLTTVGVASLEGWGLPTLAVGPVTLLPLPIGSQESIGVHTVGDVKFKFRPIRVGEQQIELRRN